jgi:hypothetical protein
MLDHATVVGDRRRPPLTVVLDIAKPLGACVRECRADLRRAFERATAGVGEDRLERLLGRSLREVA